MSCRRVWFNPLQFMTQLTSQLEELPCVSASKSPELAPLKSFQKSGEAFKHFPWV